MNLQRREEIRKMCADPARGGTQGAKQIFDLRDAVSELFAHIDTLEQTAAERVIADGKARAVVYPKCEPIQTSGQREKDIWNDGFAHGWRAGLDSDERKLVEASAVVVPPAANFTKIELGFGRVEVGEGTWMDVPALIFGKNGNGVVGKPTEAGSRFLGVDECLAVVTFANVKSLDVLLGKLMKCRSDRFPSAIPAHRELGEGMVAVYRDEIDLLRLLRDRAIDTAPDGELRGIAKYALRANQGGPRRDPR